MCARRVKSEVHDMHMRMTYVTYGCMCVRVRMRSFHVYLKRARERDLRPS